MYDILSKILTYIKEIDPSFKIPKNPKLPFICPSCKHPDNTAILLDKSFIIKCNNKGCKQDIGTIVDVVRILEPEKFNFSHEEILNYLAKKYNISYNVADNIPVLLDFYEKNDFDLVPVASGKKKPVERDWTNKSHKEKWQWENWLEDGLNIGCYDEQTEILTENGWKFFKDLNKTEKVATLNPDTGFLEYHHPTKYIEYDYSGIMYALKSKTLDLLITPNHSVYYRKGKRNHYLTEVDKIPELKRPTKPIGIPLTAKWRGNKTPYLDKNKYIISENGITDSEPLVFDLSDWVEFLGWYLSEGHFAKNSCKVYWRCCISQSYKNPEKREEIKKLLNRMGLSYSEVKQGFIFSNKLLWNYLKQFGKSYEKFIPKDIKQLDIKYLNILYNTLVKGDGCSSNGIESYYSSSKQMADDVSELLLKLGYSFVLYEREPHFGNVVKKIPKILRPSYVVTKKLKKYRCIRYKNVSKVKYNGKVYCVEVPNHIIYVKRGSQVCWCGNCKTGKMSGVTVVDVDIDPIPEELLALLGENTLFQKTGKGTHYFYKYEPSLPKTRIVDLHTDIENNGGQVIVAPSVVEGHKRTIELYDVQPMPEALKKFLLSKTRDKSAIAPIPAARADENIQWDDINFEGAIKEGNRHLNFMKFGGILRKKLNLQEVSYTLSMVNKFLCDPPLTTAELQNIVNSINRYTHLDEKDLAYKILDYIEKVEEASARDVREALEFRKEHIDLALSALVKDGYLIRTRRFFKVIKKLPWKDEWFDEESKIHYKMPYFNDLHVFREGDLMIIGAQTGRGKTHLACNMMKRLIEQGIKPKYVNLESANRFLTIAKKLGLTEGDFHWAVNYSPETMELDDRSFTIIDWLLPNDYAETDKIYKYFSEQLARHKGILCIFVQLKFDDSWFAPNQIEMFPSFAAKFVYEDQLGEKSKFVITKIREAKSKNRFCELKTVYDWGSRELLTEQEYEERRGANAVEKNEPLEVVETDDKFNLEEPKLFGGD
jgi:hypothetical protein